MGNHTRDSASTLRGERARVERCVAKCMAARERAENELRLLVKLTQEIAAAQDFESALATRRRNICEATSRDYGEAWVPDAEARLLTTTAYWLRAGLDEQRFETLRKGVGFAPMPMVFMFTSRTTFRCSIRSARRTGCGFSTDITALKRQESEPRATYFSILSRAARRRIGAIF